MRIFNVGKKRYALDRFGMLYTERSDISGRNFWFKENDCFLGAHFGEALQEFLISLGNNKDLGAR